MSDQFDVPVSSAVKLDRSHLVDGIQFKCEGRETFSALLDKNVATFHEVSGGWNPDDEYHVINLIHTVQGSGSPTTGTSPDVGELHIGDDFFWLDVLDSREYNDYPDDSYILSLHVSDYEMGEDLGFGAELTAPIDRRETRFEK
jgi:hypothetical protein